MTSSVLKSTLKNSIAERTVCCYHTRMLISIDTEASGPCPTLGDVIDIGAVVVETGLSRTFTTGIMLPMFDAFNERAYRSIGMTREEHLAAPITVEEGFLSFGKWLDSLGDERKMMVSDNPAFDWQWVNFGLCLFYERNPLGFSARRIGDMYSGLRRNIDDQNSWKKLRVTAHNHKPLNDAMGNAEALLKIWEK